MTFFKRRAGQQNWSEKMHTFKEARHGHVEDTEGRSFPMSIVKPVSSRTEAVEAPVMARGGSKKVDERRTIALRPWLEPLLAHIRRQGEQGLSLHKAGQLMAAQPGFTQALRDQRATLAQMVRLWPESIRIEKPRGHPVLHTTGDAPAPRAGTLDAFAA